MLLHRYPFHSLLLLLWIAVGTLLRWLNLTAKPLWTDEFATIVFSLGNSFQPVPIDQVITAEQLLAPLHWQANTGIDTVVQHLFSESNHPPLYFVLNHLWLRLFPTADGYVSLAGLRSLPALMGVLCIPATFGLAWVLFRSLWVSQFSALLMALSPFAIYLAHDARHYTLPMLWIIGSLSCLAIALRRLQTHQPLPLWMVLLWIGVNGLGIATHYFFLITVLAEALVLVGSVAIALYRGKLTWASPYLVRIGLVGLGTVTCGLVWLPFLTSIPDTQLTEWIYRRDTGLSLTGPLVQMVAGWLTMLYLLPIQADSEWVKQLSGAILIGLLIWTIPKLWVGIRTLYAQPHTRQPTQGIGGFVGGAIAIMLGLTYGFGMDLPSAFRYNFVYFPGVVVGVGAVLAQGWGSDRPSPSGAENQQVERVKTPLKQTLAWGGHWLSSLGRRSIWVILIMSLLGGLTVATDLGYKKPHRPEVVAADVAEVLADHSTPTLIAIPHYTHGQTGRLMGLAWALRRQMAGMDAMPMPQFLLAHEVEGTYSSLHTLHDLLMQQPRPLDVWLVNFPLLLEQVEPWLPLHAAGCRPRSPLEGVDGYRYQRFHCTPLRQ